MSCQLLPYSQLNDIVGIRNYLFPGLKDASIPSASSNNKTSEDKKADVAIKNGQPCGNILTAPDGWEEDWGNWNEEGEPTSQVEDEMIGEAELEAEATNGVGHKWFQDCLLSISPAADLIAMANENRLIIMAPKYGSDSKHEEDTIRYGTVWSGTVSSDHGEFATAILCVPLASQKRSTQGAPDWTCILVGFSTGYVRMYTETGTLLLSQKLHTEPVQKLKCKTYTQPRYLGIAEQHEEIVILYMRALVTIDGFSLFQALKACRNQVARATASGETSLQPPPLAYKKWGPQGMESIVDCHTTGMHTPNPFDQMVLASMSSHNAPIRPTPPAASMYLISGMGPYLGFFYAVEGSAQPILSEVAYAVASKLKSAFISAASGWLSFGSKTKGDTSVEKQPKIEPATPLPLRFGVPDQRREGLCVCLSPNNTYAACTDSFGRVMLIDMDRGIVVRMWKGYRDAQVGWVEVREDDVRHASHSKQSRIAQFLVIYAARRGILEVWMTGNGPRVAAFNVSKYCQLIYISHGILGLNNVTSKGIKIKAFQVALMDPDGTVKTVAVPFHLALSDKNNKRVRDMHLLKKIKQVLKENIEESESLDTQVKDLLLNIKISNIAQQAVERILCTRYLSPKFMEGIIKACIHRLHVLGDVNLDIERRLFMQYCHMQQRLIQTYTDIDQLQGDSPPVVIETQALSRLLGLSESEVEHVICHVDRCQRFLKTSKTAARVRFDSDSVSHISGFLNCFTCTPRADLDTSQQGTHQQGTSAISLVKDLTDEKKLQLGTFLFDRCIKHQCSASDLGAMLKKSGIPMEDIEKLLIWMWLYDSKRTIDSVPSLFSILKILTTNIDKSRVVVDSNTESPWWMYIRHLCSHSHHCLSAYLASIVSRSVAMDALGIASKAGELEAESSKLSSKDPDADTISCTSDASPTQEPGIVPLDIQVWNVFVKQLEDLTCVECLLKLSPGESTARVACPEEITVSVAGLLEGGKGCITEVVARHVARVGFEPEDLYQTVQQDDSVTHEAIDTDTPCDIPVPTTNKEIIWDQMQLLRKRFPHSLENDVLFSNSCWEYTVLWNKQPEDIENFKSALDFLKLVQNAMLRQGVASMMWHMFVSKKFQAAAQLMEKVGKVPKDRLCRKDVGIGENRLPLFINYICDFFNVIMEANCETNEVPVFNLEPLWHKVKGTVSLVELAIDQKATNYGLLKLHHQLAVLMYAVLIFNMKSVKVISLFDAKGKHALFQELHCHPLLPNHTIDTTISVQRKQFLTRVISQSVMKMRESYSPPSSEPGSPGTSTNRLKLTETGRWPEMVIKVGEEFGLDPDYLKRHHVCELFSAGFDKLAEEVLLTVNEHECLGTQLLAIVGQRVAFRLSKLDSHAVVELMSNVNPALRTWLKSMNPKLLVHPDVSISDLQALVTQTLHQLSDGHPEYELAISMVELVQVL